MFLRLPFLRQDSESEKINPKSPQMRTFPQRASPPFFPRKLLHVGEVKIANIQDARYIVTRQEKVKEEQMSNMGTHRQTTVLRFIVVGVLTLLALLVMSTGVALAAPAAKDPVAGQEAWENNLCKNCHGAQGEGKWAAPLAGTERTAAELIAQVRTPFNRMPRFSAEQVSDQTLTDIQAYLASLPKTSGFTPTDAGLTADAPAGQQLVVEKKCVACHTATGPIQPFQLRGETPTAQAVIAQLRNPKNLMPSFRADQVSDPDAGLIAELLASQLAAPAALPVSGGSTPSVLPLALALVGAGLLLSALALRWRAAHS